MPENFEGRKNAVKDGYQRGQERARSAFGTHIISATSSVLDIPSAYPFSSERLAKITEGTVDPDADFVDAPGRWELSVNGNAGDAFELRSRQRVPYVPNNPLLWGVCYQMQDGLEAGHKLTIAFTDPDRDEGYFLEVTNDSRRAFIKRNGVEIDPREWGHETDDEANDPTTDAYERADLDETTPQVARTFLSWYGAGPARFTVNSTLPGGSAENPTVAKCANREDVATGEINLKLSARLACTADTTAATLNVMSMGALIRGDDSVTNRVKDSPPNFDLGGDIGGELTPILAIRRRPELANVPTQLTGFQMFPSDRMSVTAIAFDEDDPDLDIAGADWNVPPQQDEDNTAVEQTTAVTTFPTDGDGNPDGRSVASLNGVDGQGNSRQPTAADVVEPFYEDEVVVFLAQSPDAASATVDLPYRTRQEW